MAALTFNQVPQARLALSYEQRDIVRDVAPGLLSLTYTDRLTGQSDDLDLELHDAEGFWLNAWYPGHGDSLALGFSWAGSVMRQLGRFEIDEIELSGPPSTVHVRALAAGIRKAVRTVEHRAYESVTLDKVAQQIAARQGLALVGSIEPIALDRLTQQESDLAFLAQLAEQYDYAFKVRGTQLVFHRISELAASSPVLTVEPADLEHWSIRDSLKQVPAAVAVRHHEPTTQQLVAYDLVNGEIVAVPSSASKTTTSADTKKRRKRTTGADSARAQAKADAAKAQRERTTGSLTLMGAPVLVSGNVIALDGFGKLSGNYLITSARHTFSRTGYRSALEVCRVTATAIGFTQDSSKPDMALTTYG
ncbi:phage late control D family protein [Stutzerimonas kirkiae]|uniref:phage late control D family protein n=1 Tax=Stutzerimonas kirkiae TaxID=2211392 RepID=UPI0010383960|nr:contractile injection system protein, VgrG/Pvc8 family [Stutzerimonas kirkiae]TBV10266.1 late control protein D [Stutzerimonas kirkiae]